MQVRPWWMEFFQQNKKRSRECFVLRAGIPELPVMTDAAETLHLQHDAWCPVHPEKPYSVLTSQGLVSQKLLKCSSIVALHFPEGTPTLITHKTDREQLFNQPVFWKGSCVANILSCCTWLQRSQGSCRVNLPWLDQIYTQQFALWLSLCLLGVASGVNLVLHNLLACRKLKLFHWTNQWPSPKLNPSYMCHRRWDSFIVVLVDQYFDDFGCCDRCKQIIDRNCMLMQQI